MRIILIGLMGAGKTTIGKKLSNKLNFKFIDMDDEIENKSNLCITEIFELYGEDKFRELESQLLKKLLLEDKIVISTGGGIIKSKENCELLKSQEQVIFLDGSIKTLLRNLSNAIENRPLLKESNNVKLRLEALLNERYEKYNESSNIKVNIDDKNINEVVNQILVYIR